MENLQNLSLLFHEQNVFTAISLGIFFVFICGITKSLLYLAGEKASYLFDSMSVSSYISKTASPEPIRLKILFLSFPKQDKALLADYLQEPTEKPSKVFSKTLEQLKCEILTITNYNRNIAMFFFLVTGVTILLSSVGSLETKILGMVTFGLILFCIDTACNGVFALMKYFSHKTFRSLIVKLDDFHGLYNAKFRNGLITYQNPNSPFARPSNKSVVGNPHLQNTPHANKSVVESLHLQNTPHANKSVVESSHLQNTPHANKSVVGNPNLQKPQLANVTVNSDSATQGGIIQSPENDVLKRRPHQVFQKSEIARPCTTIEAVTAIQNKENSNTSETETSKPIASPEILSKTENTQQKAVWESDTNQNSETAKTLLEKIKTATDTLDFESVEVLSEKLTELCKSTTLSASDHKTLQEGLDELLKEFQSVEEGVCGA